MAPGCPYCAASAPALNEFYEKYHDQGLEVIGFYHHKSPEPLRVEDVSQYAQRFGFKFPVAIDHDWKTLKHWWPGSRERTWTSVSFLIDKRGVIRHIHPDGHRTSLGGKEVKNFSLTLECAPECRLKVETKMEPKKEQFQIGEVSRETGSSIDTIRYYEKFGLLERPIRSIGGFRLYSGESIEKLRFIKKAQALGLTLGESKGILQCSQEGLKPCCELVRKLFTRKIDEFESKIKELQKMKKDLEALLSQWVSAKEARKRSYAVCPQIEREPVKKKRR
jgi:DNA-binding transcriptional MerR regulator/peroxiredoxin